MGRCETLGPIDIQNLQKGKDYYYFPMYFNSQLIGWLNFSTRGADGVAPARYDSFAYADTNTEEKRREPRERGIIYKLAGDDDANNDKAPFNELFRCIFNTQLLLRRAPQHILQCSFSFYEGGRR